jgi:galactose mutarotase-like enzyme
MNTYIIKNDYLTLELSEKGGEPISIKSADGYEYLWCRDAKYWSSSAPVLFPTVGRLRGGEWADGEKIYKMSNHGFARHQLMKAVAMQDFAEFTLRDSAESKECYPYAFTLRRRFKLAKNAILETITVKNDDTRDMFFGIGLHPGFMIPEGRARLSLECHAAPERQLLAPSYQMADKSEPYTLEDGKYITLDNSLFDNDAIILTGVTSATLESPDSPRSVTVTFPDAPYVGFWQPANSDAPFLCIEPWQSLPASDAPAGSPADQICERKGFVRLAPGEVYNFNCRFIFN